MMPSDDGDDGDDGDDDYGCGDEDDNGDWQERRRR